MIKDYKYTFIFIGACILIILSVIFYYYKVSERFPDPHAASAFGDMFGGLSALFFWLVICRSNYSNFNANARTEID
ncbi:MAG: hypothetical protein IPN72_22265 [Saprospiraceae bacterium]|nr:hypothetical protein [Saprospiraceae bacterium]